MELRNGADQDGFPMCQRSCCRFVALLLAFSVTGCHGLRGPDEAGIAQELHERTGHYPAGSPLPGQPCVPDFVTLQDGLDENECVALAICNNTAYLELLGDLGLAQADIITAGMISNPQLLFLAPVGGIKQLESTLQVPLDVLLIPWRLKAAEGEAARVAERLVQGGLDLVRDVRTAYADVVVAKERVRYADEVAKLRNRIGQLAEARFKAGDASQLEAQTARIDALRGQEEAARLTYDITVAENRLRTLIGFAQSDTTLRFVDATELPSLEVNLPAVVEEAINWRPDVRAPLWAAEAARQRVKLAKWGQFGLRALGDINAFGVPPSLFQIGPGVLLDPPIFNQNQGRIASAKAQMEKAIRAHAAARDRAAQEVRQAHALYEQAKTDLVRWEKQIRPAVEEAERRALKAYEGGEATLLLTLEASRQLVETRVREAQLRGDLRRAWAELERSAGRRILPPSPEIHEGPPPRTTPVPIRVGRRSTP